MPIVLGLSISHTTSACIVADGEVKAAVLEERLSRRKFDASFPAAAIRKVLQVAGVAPGDVERIAIGALCDAFDPNRAQDKEYRLGTRLVSGASAVVPPRVLGSWPVVHGYRWLAGADNRRKFFRSRAGTLRDLGLDPGRVRFYDHHTCHAATAYWASPWRDDVLVFTSDGNGDGYCGTVSTGTGDGLRRIVSIPSIHSLGGLYARATRMLGMKPWQDEYKVMGLAPWGARRQRAEAVYRKLQGMWSVEGLAYRNRAGWAGETLRGRLNRVLDDPRFDDVAYAVQRLLEEVLSAWVENGVAALGPRRLGFAGGVFYNVKATKRIVERVAPRGVFVFPAAGDEGVSVGAAYHAHAELLAARGVPATSHPIEAAYWGEPIDAAIDRAVRGLPGSGLVVERVEEIERRVASLLARNEIVAVCDGPMEFGPRALGNRSILANPSDARNIERLNDSIKSRDFWMPFGLSILAEHQDRYLVNPHGIASPYMMLAFDTRPERRPEIEAGIHRADKSVRPQILDAAANPRYHRLLGAFHEMTGIGAVVNTSLNLHGDPMVNLPEEAIDLLHRSGLRHLALGSYLISKPNGAAPESQAAAALPAHAGSGRG